MPDSAQIRSNPPVNMSLKEAALYLAVSERKLWDESSKGKIRAARIGSRLIFPRAELDRYINVLLAVAS